MERRALGRSEIEVPRIGLGTWKVFNVQDDASVARCEAVVDAALDGGANLFDSSPMYGRAEEVLAYTLQERRDRAIVATKVWAKNRAIGEGQIERALELFGGNIDVYQVHNLLLADELLPILSSLKAEGAIGCVGATHYLESAEGALIELIKDGAVGAVQVPYHPLDSWVERAVLGEAERAGVGVIAMTPLGSGRLLESTPTSEELAPLASFGVHTWAQALLKWVLSDPRVAVAIPATSSADHMRENALAGAPPFFGEVERRHVRRLAQKYA